MTPERWRKISGLYLQVMDLAPADRDGFWKNAGEADLSLRGEVEKLIAADQDTRGLTDAVHQVADAVAQDSLDRLAGRRFGAWRTVGIIGQGGMGAVYKAVRDDRQFEKEAAIKVLRTAGIDLRFALARFRHERELLAELEHPNIARLIDGGEIVSNGTGETISYIVMEFVEGRPITDYCSDLSIEAKLRIFLQVCEAVQYAHQKLIVHRDLKPGNILVTEAGVPKLLDFGIAKLLDPDPGAEMETDTVTGWRSAKAGRRRSRQYRL
jgi:serine/threonine protein kinase